MSTSPLDGPRSVRLHALVEHSGLGLNLVSRCRILIPPKDVEMLVAGNWHLPAKIAILGSRLRRRTLGVLILSPFVVVLLFSTISYDPFGIQPLLSLLPARFWPFQKSPPISNINMSPPVKRTAAVIFSHGLGDSSAGWSFLAEQLGSHMPWVNWV
ncbi:hypothetical protein PtB15_13B40 [Puccinia triticina]|nr:hypothetical protein PtB15_13B40 [Puccinia triticina]